MSTVSNTEDDINKPNAIPVTITNFLFEPMDCIPPDIRAILEKQHGGGDEEAKQQEQENSTTPPENVIYNFGMVNASEDLENFVNKLVKSPVKKYAILLYGESGSGKSQLGKYIAQQLGLPFIKKKASDLIDKWIGATERNIKAAFKEAREKNAILLIDEADTFLYDRTFSQREHEVAQVNEILTQMEDFPFPLIMTTNLKSKIDKASMRRFVFKIKFDYMKPENVIEGVKEYFGDEYKLTEEQVAKLPYLCAGDFSLIKQKIEILEKSVDNEIIYQYLLKEQEEKDIKESSNITL